MKPSSKATLLALAAPLACLALWPVDGVAAAPAGHGFSQRTFVQAPHRGATVANPAANVARRHMRPGGDAFGWPTYWSDPLPNAAAYPEDDAPGFVPPPFYPPPWLMRPAPCSEPLVIKVKATKPTGVLPRVVYGVPSACGD